MTVKINRNWLLIVISLILASCGGTEKQNSPTKGNLREVPVIKVVAKDTVLHRQYVADIKAIQNVELRARVQGFLEEIHVDEGQYVNKGQLLFKTNDEEYRADLAKAKANLQSAKAEAKVMEFEMERLKVLVDKNVISESELELTKAKYEAVLAKIEEAKSAETNATVRLSYSEIRAPFSGIIDRIPQRTGSLIDHGTLLTSISDVSAVHVYFNVSEREYLEYMQSALEETTHNDVIQLTLANGVPYPYEGMIETMEGEFNANTGSIAFRAKFPNPNSLLKHGATGRVILTNAIRNAIIIPQKTVFEIQDRSFVYVVDENNEVHMKSIIPKARFSHYYIVESGLTEGERIVYEGLQNVKDGMSIVPQAFALENENPEEESEAVSMMNTSMP
jgi:membrane fusion protein, multidrug efflux system